MSPSLYDLLDVEETASAEEIRQAWRAAITDLDPTDRRFRAFNDAAGVLLDPAKRADYDARLAAERAAEEETADGPPASVPAATADPHAVDPVDPDTEADTVAVAGTDTGDDTAVDSDDDSDTADGSDEVDGDEHDQDDQDDEEEAGHPAGPPRWALAAAAVGAVLALALAVLLLVQPGGRLFTAGSPSDVAEQNNRQQRAALTAEAAAEKMVEPVLSYSHKTMAEDLERIRANMTEQMGDKQAAAWPELTKEAEAQGVVVEATPAGTALTRIAPDGKRATVLVYVDQQVEKRGAEPFVLRMWATLSLVQQSGSEGRWLLDDLCTESACG